MPIYSINCIFRVKNLTDILLLLFNTGRCFIPFTQNKMGFQSKIVIINIVYAMSDIDCLKNCILNLPLPRIR